MLNPAKDPKYFIAIVPPPPVYGQVMEWKQHFKEAFNSKGALKSPPHLTLHMPFLWKEKKEDLLVEKLKNFATHFNSFPIELDGFGAFVPRVIFLKVLANPQLSALQASLIKFCKTELQLFNAQYKDLPFYPHITVAFRDLKKEKFAEAWPQFENKTLRKSFLCGEITLLKHNGSEWISLKHFSLSNHQTISNLV